MDIDQEPMLVLALQLLMGSQYRLCSRAKVATGVADGGGENLEVLLLLRLIVSFNTSVFVKQVVPLNDSFSLKSLLPETRSLSLFLFVSEKCSLTVIKFYITNLVLALTVFLITTI
jgi:hypothetical protein